MGHPAVTAGDPAIVGSAANEVGTVPACFTSIRIVADCTIVVLGVPSGVGKVILLTTQTRTACPTTLPEGAEVG
jgi:hypothetical protein